MTGFGNGRRRLTHRRRAGCWAALAAATLLAAGCSGADDDAGAEGAAPIASETEGMTVQAALDSPGTPLTVHGWIVAHDGALRLCTTRVETEPPSCGDPSLILDGYAGTISAIEEISVDGTVEGDRLVVDLQALLDRGNVG